MPPLDAAALVDSKFEYVVACQIYHKLRFSADPADRLKATQIDELRHQYARRVRVAYIEVRSGSAPTEATSFFSVLLGLKPRAGACAVLRTQDLL